MNAPDDLTDAERMVFEMINRAAERGSPCPSNGALGWAAGEKSDWVGRNLIKKLERRGLIRVIWFRMFRTVEITATGKTTARRPFLTEPERVAFRMIYDAAVHDQPCPTNIDLEDAVGYNTSSGGAKLVRKLEQHGLIRVNRFQRFRIVEIAAIGKTTARHPSMRVDRPLVSKRHGNTNQSQAILGGE